MSRASDAAQVLYRVPAVGVLPEVVDDLGVAIDELVEQLGLRLGPQVLARHRNQRLQVGPRELGLRRWFAGMARCDFTCHSLLRPWRIYAHLMGAGPVPRFRQGPDQFMPWVVPATVRLAPSSPPSSTRSWET